MSSVKLSEFMTAENLSLISKGFKRYKISQPAGLYPTSAAEISGLGG